jgi:type IV pilus assembly protein PilQ
VAPTERFHSEQKQADEAAQDALDAQRKKEQLVPLMTEKIRVNYAKAEQMKERVSDVLSSRGKATFDERTNIVIVRDAAEYVETARQLVESLDWPTPQVMIEARIVEATTTFSRELGTQWGAEFQKTYGAIDGTVGVQGRSGVTGTPSNVPFLVNLPTSTTFGGIGFAFSKLSGALDIDARLLASEAQGKLHIISSPRISTLDNTEAYIQQGEDIPYLSQSVDGISTQFVQTALKLTVTPHITPDGRVRMKIKAEKSEPSDRVVNGTPGILRKETMTEVLVNHGETVVIGGILKDTNRTTDNRIPFFHKIPGLGWLFKSQRKSQDKQELLIFITPKIVAMEKTPAQAI